MKRDPIARLLSKNKPYHPDFDPTADALVRASDKGELAKVRALVNAGISINAIGDKQWGYYPIHAAAEKGHQQIVRYLLDAGARTDVRTAAEYEQQQNTPLILAASGEHFEIVRALVGAGADVNAPSLQDNTALTKAIQRRNRRLFDYLIGQGARPDSGNLRVAVGRGDIAIVGWFLDRGFDVNQDEGEGHRSLLSVAISKSMPDLLEMIEFLISHGANVNKPSGDFAEPPLVQATRQGKWEIAKLLLENGADPNIGSVHQAYALNYAVRRNSLETVELLLQKGAKLNSVDFENRNPLEWAVEGRDKASFEFLIKRGATVPKKMVPTIVRRFGKAALKGATIQP